MSPQLFNEFEAKVSWSKVSYEMDKGLERIFLLKTEKQCKERWFNHLTPFLNKSIKKKKILFFNQKKNRKKWTLDEDIILMREFIENNKKWAKIARKFNGRTQHQIKNHFFALLNKELDLSREKLKELISRKHLLEISKLALDSLIMKKTENLSKNLKNMEKLIFLEGKKNEKNCEKDEISSSFSLEMEFNVDLFINFQREESIFKDFS